MDTPKVLLVNDDRASLLAMESVLALAGSKQGYQVITATSGREALGKVLKHEFAVIILDVSMPDMDGFETAREIRSRARSAAVPIVFVSAQFDDEVSHLKGYATGAVDFIHTPIVPAILLAKVAIFVDLQRQANQLLEMNRVLLARQRSAEDKEQRIRTIVDNVGEGIVTLGEDGLIETFNRAASRIFGYAPEDAIGQEFTLLLPDRLRHSYRKGMRRYLDGAPSVLVGHGGVALPGLRKDGCEIPLELAVNEMIVDRRRLFVAIIRDITERKKAEAAVLAEQERLRITLNSIGDAVGDAVITINLAGKVTYMNPVAVNLTGWPEAEAHGKPLNAVFKISHEKTGEPLISPAILALAQRQVSVSDEDIQLCHRDGKLIAVQASAAPICDGAGAAHGTVLIFRDVRQEREMAAQMNYQATHDALTGLINRREFELRLGKAIKESAEHEQRHCLLYLDLDQFKVVNDTCGHGAGDELLRQLTGLFKARLRQSDTIARLGGDEFGVLLDSCPAASAFQLADQLRQTVSDFHFVWADKAFAVGVSIGLVSFGGADGHVSLADILRMADAACYVAKEKGRNRIHIYTPEDKELERRHNEMGWVGRIKKVLAEQRFTLYAQRILPLAEEQSRMQHVELLLRMQDEDGNMVAPMAFIPAAERYNLMPAIDRWVIHEAFSRLAARQGMDAWQGTYAINLSGASIGDEHFIDFVREQFSAFQLPASQICFEITETSAIANLSQAAALIAQLREMGCSIALDDFGSGMSSFTYLKQLQVDFLKIDGSFVKDIVDDPIDLAMVEAINKIGHVMGIRTIAEYVESPAILAVLRRLGVDYAQGFAIGKPQPAWEMSDAAIDERMKA